MRARRICENQRLVQYDADILTSSRSWSDILASTVLGYGLGRNPTALSRNSSKLIACE